MALVAITELRGAWEISTHTIGTATTRLVAAYLDDGVQIIDITDPTMPSAVAALTDGVGGFNTLDSPRGITTHTIGNKHYALVAARFDYGVQIIDITDPGYAVGRRRRDQRQHLSARRAH